MTRLHVSMRKPPTPKRVRKQETPTAPSATEWEDEPPGVRYHRDPLIAHFIPSDFLSGPLHTSSLDYSSNRAVRAGITDTSSGAAQPGNSGRACAKGFVSRSDMLRARKKERREAFLGSAARVACAAESNLAGLADRFGIPQYLPEYDLNGDGVVDPFESFVCSLVDSNGDGKISSDEREKLQDMLDRGDLAGLAFLQDKNGAACKRALTWWNSAEEQRRVARRKQSALEADAKVGSIRESHEQHRLSGGVSAKLLEAVGLPLDSIGKLNNSIGSRAGDKEGAFTSDTSLGPERRTMVGRNTPRMEYKARPRFRSRRALLEWRKQERQPTGMVVDLSGKALGIPPEEALVEHYRVKAERGTLTETDKEVGEVILSSAADTGGAWGAGYRERVYTLPPLRPCSAQENRKQFMYGKPTIPMSPLRGGPSLSSRTAGSRPPSARPGLPLVRESARRPTSAV
jgi:hypothetical protein